MHTNTKGFSEMGKNSIKPAPEPDGRPTKFTPERCLEIIKAISRRVPYQLAAEANGISRRTLFYWMEEGARDLEENIDSDFARFLHSIKKAEMEKIVEHMDNIAEKPDRWQADAWLLERRWYKYFSSSVPVIELNERVSRLETGEPKHDAQEA